MVIKENMDLSNLSNNLPLTRSITKESIDEIKQQLNNEFKNAAKSVTNLYAHILQAKPPKSSHPLNPQEFINARKYDGSKEDFTSAAKSVASLYRLSSHSNYLNHHYGYLACLNDMIQVLKSDGELENWVLTKRNEIINNNIESKTEISADESSSDESKIPDLSESLLSEYEFKMNKALKAPYKFHLSYPPLSVTHNQRQRTSWKNRKEKKPKFEEKELIETDDKKRKLHGSGNTRKKRKDRFSL